MQSVRTPFRDEPGERLVRIAFPIPKAKPLRHPPDMRIHRKFLETKAEKEHHVRGFLPHPGKGKKPFFRVLWEKLSQKIQGELAPLPLDPFQDRADRSRPFPVQPRGPDRLRYLFLFRVKEVFPSGETRAQIFIG